MASGLGSGAAGASTAPAAPPASRTAPNAHARASGQHPPGGFAGVLAGTGQADSAPPSTAAETRPMASDDTGQPTDEAVDDKALPDQILNLLGGWPDAAPATGIGDGSPAAGSALGLPGDADVDLGVPMPAGGSGTPPGGAILPGLPDGADAESSATVAAGRIGGMVLPGIAGAFALNPPAATGDNDGAGAGAAGILAGSIALAADSGDDALPAAGASDATGDAVEFALPAGQLATTSPARLAAAAAASEPVAMPADPDAGFDDAFGARIGWLADQRIGHAQIRVSPDHVGPIDVRLQLDGTRVSAEFTSANADVRHALEASVGRLRDMLGQQGLQLGHAGVGSGQSDSPGERGSAPARGMPRSGDGSGVVNDLPEPALTRRGLLDEYA